MLNETSLSVNSHIQKLQKSKVIYYPHHIA